MICSGLMVVVWAETVRVMRVNKSLLKLLKKLTLNDSLSLKFNRMELKDFLMNSMLGYSELIFMTYSCLPVE